MRGLIRMTVTPGNPEGGLCRARLSLSARPANRKKIGIIGLRVFRQIR
jgi:hypothetical protein